MSVPALTDAGAPRAPRVCLLSPIHTWLNPRLVKEADALHANGFDVVVGYRSSARWARERDAPILARKPWAWHRFDLAREDSPVRWFVAAVREKVAQHLVRIGLRAARLDAEAYCRGYGAMLRWAIAQKADLYIAHGQPALAIAAAAAVATGARFAFDCEDLLSEEASDGGGASWRRDTILRLEATHFPKAAYVSTTSIPTRGYLHARYRLPRIPVWTNSFPLAELRGVPSPEARATNARVKLAWISGTLAPGRGLEDILSALPHMPEELELHLFGNVLPKFRGWLDDQVRAAARPDLVFVHPLPGPPDVLPTLATCDVGLALDQNDCLNRSTTICNKMCLYLQAGLATIATATLGQVSVLRGQFEAGLLYEPGEIEELVGVLHQLRDRNRLEHMKREAWRAGMERYNWDVEQRVFLDAVRDALL